MLEVCVDTFESAMAAVEGGAARIELCTALSEGGLTPTVGLLKTIKRHYPQLVVFAMLRPHGGSSYVYTDVHMQCILSDMQCLSEHGVDGYVFGALNVDRTIDERASIKVLQAAAGLPVTFHRAFDETNIEQVIANCLTVERLGFQRLLTSGCFNTADNGAYTIRSMVEATEKLLIMPGAGINVINAATILHRTGCKEFHSSARATHGKSVLDPPYRTDAEIVRRLVEIGRQSL